jgi:peptide/nickel transport system substrate-binding protein
MMLGQADPAYTYIDPGALDYNPSPRASSRKTSPAPRSCSTKPAGSPARRHPVKDGKRLAPVVYIPQVSYFREVSEAIQGYMRKIGVDWKITALDSTIMPAKLAQPGLRPVDGDVAVPVGRRR